MSEWSRSDPSPSGVFFSFSMNFANMPTQRTLIFAARATFSAWSP
jgi:hypothetical protein